MEYNIYKINNLFLDNEMDFLINELKEKFKSTVEIHKKNIDYNHELGMAYVNDLEREMSYHIDEGLFISYYTKYVNDANSEEIYNNLEYNFNKIKLSIINDYSFGKNVFKDNFLFY